MVIKQISILLLSAIINNNYAHDRKYGIRNDFFSRPTQQSMTAAFQQRDFIFIAHKHLRRYISHSRILFQSVFHVFFFFIYHFKIYISLFSMFKIRKNCQRYIWICIVKLVMQKQVYIWQLVCKIYWRSREHAVLSCIPERRLVTRSSFVICPFFAA